MSDLTRDELIETMRASQAACEGVTRTTAGSLMAAEVCWSEGEVWKQAADEIEALVLRLDKAQLDVFSLGVALDKAEQRALAAESRLSRGSNVLGELSRDHPDEDTFDGGVRYAVFQMAAALGEPDCECPGWCFFNPGTHHANCKCKATEHTKIVVERHKPGCDGTHGPPDCGDTYCWRGPIMNA